MKTCLNCNYHFEDGDLVIQRGEKYLHTFFSRGGDELDCDDTYDLKTQSGINDVGKFKVFYHGNFYDASRFGDAPENIQVMPRNDHRGSRLTGDLSLILSA
jgi:hypothetical protein